MESKTNSINDYWSAELSDEEHLIREFGYSKKQLTIDIISFILVFSPSLFILIGFILLPIGAFFIHYYWSRTPRYALTNTRIICIEGLLSKTKKYIDYTKITDITMQQGMIGKLIEAGTLLINTAGGPEKEMKLTYIDEPGRIKDQIYKIANVSPKSSIEPKITEVRYTQELEKLAELRDKKIITVEEFEAKKKQLLGL